MNRKSMFLIVFLAICLMISPNISFANGVDNTEVNSFEPSALLPRQKTVRETYTSLGNIPDYYNYRDYDDLNDGWWTGLLPLKNIEVLSTGRYKATFEGTIVFSY